MDNYLTMVALEDGFAAQLSVNECEYCVDGNGNWKTLPAATNTETINTGHTLSFRGNLTPDSSNGIGRFTTTKKFNLEGNCMSMLFGDDAASNTSLSGKNYAFYELFYRCDVVEISNDFLPAQSLSTYCYDSMFQMCRELINMPNLPAKILPNYCYQSMFCYCKKLKNALESIPSEIVGVASCNAMFQECTSLVNAPELPALHLDTSSYTNMFYGCTSLQKAPSVLPSQSLQRYCYNTMFRGCSSLERASIILGLEFNADSVCTQMFYGCSKLNYIECHLDDELGSGYTSSWVYGVGTSGTFVKNSCASWSDVFGNDAIPTGWNVVLVNHELSYGVPIDTNNYLTIVALEDGLTVKLSTNACEYCVDGDGNWKTLPAATNTEAINTGQKLSFRTIHTSVSALGTFTISKSCRLEGNSLSMLYGDDANSNLRVSGSQFSSLFQNCTTIQSVSEGFLPAIAVGGWSYKYMFRGCTSLINMPELPAKSLAGAAYQNMFSDCTSLTEARIHSIQLGDYACMSMFSNCSKLNYIEMLATLLKTTSLDSWVKNVSATGTFIKSPKMTSLSSGVSGIPAGWTVEDNVTITKCKTLTISAEDVSGKYTTTNVSWVAICDAVDDSGNTVEVRKTGTFESESFPQNTSTTETITRTISFTYMGVTASTTFVHGIYIANEYTVNLNNQWRLSSNISNPDSSLYDGVYESYSNYNVHSGTATMTINITGYTSFSVYIRSYAESNYDYVMISQLDKSITGSTSYSSSDVKAHTRGSQQSGTAISNYKLVEYTNIDGGEHTITIVYRKDSSANSGDDRGYVLNPK